jgi:23S rRNA-/tRNA-specific pseudouridylate synthase
LLEAMRMQTENKKLREISRSALKALFTQHKVLIKGQPARPSSSIATGTTYVDVLI